MSRSIVAHAIQSVISDYKKDAYYNIREADYCSEIFSAIRNYLRIKSVNADIYSKNQTSTLGELIKSDVRTSRVHQGASIDIGISEGIVDIVLLRDKKVNLIASSPAHDRDILAHYRVEDIEVAVEVSCTPLNRVDINGIINDLEKLKKLAQKGVKDLHFVQINNSGKGFFDELNSIGQDIFSTSHKSHRIGKIQIWDTALQLNPIFENGAEAYDVSGLVPSNPMTLYF